MCSETPEKLIVGISSRSLFDLEMENKIFEEKGLAAYARHQIDNENRILEPGTAFSLVEALLRLNKKIGKDMVEVVIMSRNTPQTGLRIMNSVDFYNLRITRAAFLGGKPIAPILAAYGVNLYLSKNPSVVQDAADLGIATALLYKPPTAFNPDIDEIRIAFDGDAVIFSEDSELLFKEKGLEAFKETERKLAATPLPEGPFGRIFKILSHIKKLSPEHPLIRLALVTARDGPAHERVILTLRSWGVEVDEAYFLGGLPKDQIIKAFNAHIFFDDQDKYVGPASAHVPSGKVPYKSTSKLYESEKGED